METLNPQAHVILAILEDGQWHCPIDWRYSDGHGKRLTDINRYLAHFGKTLEWEWCTCGRHTTKIKMRRLVKSPEIAPEAPRHDLVPSEGVSGLGEAVLGVKSTLPGQPSSLLQTQFSL